MRRFKSKNFILCLFIFFASCGTTGHVQFYNFSASKYDVEKELRYRIDVDAGNSVPAKWADIYKNPGPIEYMYIYFPQFPEEMYQVGFTGDSNEWKYSSKCQLGLVGLFNGDRWAYRKEVSYSEMRRIRKRFEKEILFKLKYSYTKSD